MKRVTFFAAVLCLLGAGLSCTHEEPSKSERNDGNNVYEWEDSTLSGDAVMSEPMQFNMGNRLTVTRATTAFDGQSYTLSVGDRVMIELTRSDNTKEGPKVYRVTNAVTGALAYDGNETEALFWKSKSETVRLRAWSYGNSTSDTTDPVGKTFTLNTTQTETSSGIDNYNELLYAPQWSCSYSDHNGSVEVNLYHQMSRLALTLTHEATGDLSVNQVTIGNGSMPTTAKFSETGIDVANNDYVGSWTNLSTTTGTIIARQDVANQKYSAVLFPGTYAADTKLVNVKTTDSKTYSYLLPTGGTTLAAGSQYNYTITVKDGHWKTTTSTATRSNLAVGDILCSDGYIYTSANAHYIAEEHKTAIGVIAYVGTSDSDPICENRRALVMALKESGSPTLYAWGGYNFDEPNGLFPNHSNVSASGDAPATAIENAQIDYRGLEKTNYLCQSGHGHEHPGASAAKNYSVSCSGISNCTGWFLPSVGQWCAVLVYMGGQTYTEQDWRNTYDKDLTGITNINNYLSNVGSGNYDKIATGTSYLTSSEGNATRFVYVYVDISRGEGKGSHISNGDIKSSAGGYVRPFLAF